MVTTAESTKFEKGEGSASASQPTPSQDPTLRKAPIKAKPPMPNIPITVEDALPRVPLKKSTPAKAEEGEASTNASQLTPLQDSMPRKAPIKAKTPIPNVSTSMEDVLSRLPEEKSTPDKDDKTLLLPIKQTIRLIGRILSIFKITMYYTLYFGVLVLVVISVGGVLLTVVKSTICAPPFCEVKINPSSHVEFEKLGNLQAKLEEIHEASAGGVTLPLLMKRGESAAREVAVNVELSNMPSRNGISQKLREFQKRANRAGDVLRTFNSRMDRTIDSIISTNVWTARKLEEIAREEEIENSRGAIGAFISKSVALIEGLEPSIEKAIKLQYLHNLSLVKNDIDDLIIEAEILVTNLNSLEDILWTMKKFGKQDVQDISKSKSKASKTIAAVFGLNWEDIKSLEDQNRMLVELLEQKDAALARVTGTLEHLKDISARLGDMKEIVAMPGWPQAQKVPLLVRINTIHRGLERLERGRGRTRQKKDQYLNEIRDQISC